MPRNQQSINASANSKDKYKDNTRPGVSQLDRRQGEDSNGQRQNRNLTIRHHLMHLVDITTVYWQKSGDILIFFGYFQKLILGKLFKEHIICMKSDF